MTRPGLASWPLFAESSALAARPPHHNQDESHLSLSFSTNQQPTTNNQQQHTKPRRRRLSFMVPQHPRKPTNITNPPLAIKIMEGSMKPIFPRKALSCPGSISFHIPIPKTAAPASCENEEWKYDQRFYQGRYRRSFKIQILPRTPLWKEKKYNLKGTVV